MHYKENGSKFNTLPDYDHKALDVYMDFVFGDETFKHTMKIRNEFFKIY